MFSLCLDLETELCAPLVSQVFPSETPSSRTDAVMLDNWVNKALAKVEDHVTATWLGTIASEIA